VEYTLSLYHSMTSWANKALAAARVTDPTTEIAGFFWMQGEADATDYNKAKRYQANLTTLLSRLRSDFGKPGISMVIGRIYLYNQFSYCVIVRTAEVNVVNADSNAAWVNTDDFTLASDGVHFSDASVKTLGSRFAQAWLNLNPVPPTITCPANVTANTDAGHCYATGVTLGTPTTTGSGVSVWNNAAAQYPKGVTTVTWWAQDSKGNQATCTQTVTINDTEPPGGAVPPNVTVSTDSGQCYATGVALGTPTVSDNCESVTVWNNAPMVYPKGVTTVTWWAQDTGGNTISGPQTVTVNDTTPPTITCPADVTVSANAGGTATNVALGSPVTGDNCSVASVGNNAPSAYPLGATVVTWTVTDGSGNTATGVQNVTVVPSSSPPGNLAISADGGRVTITWDGGVLQQADDVLGVYTDVPEAASPYTIAVSDAQKFYRARSTVP
jgi:hypothetical protein